MKKKILKTDAPVGKASSLSQYSGGQHGSTGASQKASFDRESKWRGRMRWAGRPDVDARRPPPWLRLAAAATTHGHSILSRHLWRRLGDRIGAFALLGTGHVGQRRCWLVYGGLGGGRPRGAALSVARRVDSGFDAHCRGMSEGRKEVAVSLRLVSAITLPMHGCLFW